MGNQQKLRAQRSEDKKKKALTHITTDGLPRFSQKTSYKNYAELVSYAKKSVFMIARLRMIGENQTAVTSLGTGFLAGNGRMITNSHVINNPSDPHLDGDSYVFIARDENSWAHVSVITTLRLGETIFDFNEKGEDLAVIYLPPKFYFNDDGTLAHHPDDFLRLSAEQFGIGTDIGVLGYPMQQISFDINGGLNIDGVIIRGDKGVVNTRYIQGDIMYYDFTAAFYPGNSGGPILNIESGRVIAIVEGYRSVPIQFAKEQVPDALQQDLGVNEILSSIRSTYSFGLSSKNYVKLKDDHDISFI